MDRFRTMESFVRVVRTGSFTIAASQLGLSRALVSRHVGDLETRLGVRLVNRSTRSVNLTEEGRTYLEFCERLFADIEHNERSIIRTRVEPTGTLTLTAPKSFGELHLADAVVDFAKAQPRLRLSIMLEDVSYRAYDFTQKGIDLALRMSTIRRTSTEVRPIASLDWGICASPDYLARAGRPGTPADIVGHACLIHSNVTPTDRIWRFDGPKGRVSVKVNGAFFSNSALALRKAALAGLGIGILPRYCVAGDLAAGALVPLIPRYRVPVRPLVAVYPRSRVVPQKVQVFVEFLTKWMAARDVNHTGRAG